MCIHIHIHTHVCIHMTLSKCLPTALFPPWGCIWKFFLFALVEKGLKKPNPLKTEERFLNELVAGVTAERLSVCNLDSCLGAFEKTGGILPHAVGTEKNSNRIARLATEASGWMLVFLCIMTAGERMCVFVCVGGGAQLLLPAGI